MVFKKIALFSFVLLGIWYNTDNLFAFQEVWDADQNAKRQAVQAAAARTGNTDLPRNLQAKLEEYFRLFQANPGPHAHDATIPQATRDTLRDVVEVYLPVRCGLGAQTPNIENYLDCQDKVFAAADRLDARNALAGHVLPDWGTYRSLVAQRLAHPSGALNDATHRLLRLCGFFCDNDVQPGAITPLAGANQQQAWETLVQGMVPLNPSASAVYNVFFDDLARKLSVLFP